MYWKLEKKGDHLQGGNKWIIHYHYITVDKHIRLLNNLMMCLYANTNIVMNNPTFDLETIQDEKVKLKYHEIRVER